MDTCQDADYLATDEYALAKARQEDLLRASDRTNYTIIRPYITYSEDRLQLGVYEKEAWLYRILRGRTVLFPRDIAGRTTTLTKGTDVARILTGLIGNAAALGETIQIAQPESVTWDEVCRLYLRIIERETGMKPKLRMIDSGKAVGQVMGRWDQTRFDRLYDRRFNSEKAARICGKNLSYTAAMEGLESCLCAFLRGERRFREMDWKYEGYVDKQTHERTPLGEITGLNNRAKYLLYRYTPAPVVRQKLRRIKRRIRGVISK